jgi:predicted  nucleic acid-binding Zn-ribbon protein
MPATGLDSLYQLHRIDLAILEVRKRAAALEPGKAIQAVIAQIEKEFDQADSEAKALGAELLDLELRQKSLEAKSKKINEDLYGGKVVNPREVEAMQHELELLKKQQGECDTRMLELYDLIPPAKERADEIAQRLAAEKAKLADFQKGVLREKARLEAEFAKLRQERTPAVARVDPALLRQYEAIRQKMGGVGMAEVMPNGSCSQCGVQVPEKAIDVAKQGRVVTCEACHRILFVPLSE